nr:MAG TPA: hypothetical protein [Caudoviricetes sp.]
MAYTASERHLRRGGPLPSTKVAGYGAGTGGGAASPDRGASRDRRGLRRRPGAGCGSCRQSRRERFG